MIRLAYWTHEQWQADVALLRQAYQPCHRQHRTLGSVLTQLGVTREEQQRLALVASISRQDRQFISQELKPGVAVWLGDDGLPRFVKAE